MAPHFGRTDQLDPGPFSLPEQTAQVILGPNQNQLPPQAHTAIPGHFLIFIASAHMCHKPPEIQISDKYQESSGNSEETPMNLEFFGNLLSAVDKFSNGERILRSTKIFSF